MKSIYAYKNGKLVGSWDSVTACAKALDLNINDVAVARYKGVVLNGYLFFKRRHEEFNAIPRTIDFD